MYYLHSNAFGCQQTNANYLALLAKQQRQATWLKLHALKKKDLAPSLGK
jgi:hypothetical protein